jgi:hypothetical protein
MYRLTRYRCGLGGPFGNGHLSEYTPWRRQLLDLFDTQVIGLVNHFSHSAAAKIEQPL